MFLSGKDPLDVAIQLNLDADTTKNLYRNYLELCNLDVYSHLLDELGSDLPKFLDLYRTLKNNGLLNSEFIKYFINQYKTLDVIRSEVMESSDHLTKLYVMKVALEKEIEQKSIMNNLELQMITGEGKSRKIPLGKRILYYGGMPCTVGVDIICFQHMAKYPLKQLLNQLCYFFCNVLFSFLSNP